MRRLFIISAVIILSDADRLDASYGIRPYGRWSYLFPYLLWVFMICCKPSIPLPVIFPVFGHMRFLLEDIRPEIYQYFIESDTNGTPFNRQNRSVVYQRAKKVDDTRPFGTELNVYDDGYEWLNHSLAAIDHTKLDMDPRVTVGGPAMHKTIFSKRI